MSKENPTSFQRKTKKGRYSDNYPLFFQTIFFLFLINCLSVALTSRIEIVIQIETGEEQQFLNQGFRDEPNNVIIDGNYVGCKKNVICHQEHIQLFLNTFILWDLALKCFWKQQIISKKLI